MKRVLFIVCPVACLLVITFALVSRDPIEELRRAAHSEQPLVMGDAVTAVNRAGLGDEAMTAIEELLEGQSNSARWRAAWALGQIDAGPHLAIPLAIRALSDEHHGVRSAAAEALGELGAADDSVVPALIGALEDQDASVRMAAAWAVARIGPDAAAAVPALTVVLDDDYMGWVASDALRSIGPPARSAVPKLREILPAVRGHARVDAAEAIWKIAGDAETAVPALIECLREPDLLIQREAAEALGRIGPAASAATPALIKHRDYQPKVEEPRPQPPAQGRIPAPVPMTESEFYPQVREAAARALEAIQAKEDE